MSKAKRRAAYCAKHNNNCKDAAFGVLHVSRCTLSHGLCCTFASLPWPVVVPLVMVASVAACGTAYAQTVPATSLDVIANNTDVEGDILSVSDVGQATNGTTTIKQGSTTEVTYAPNTNFNGSDSFTYTVSDGTTTDTGTANVNVVAPLAEAVLVSNMNQCVASCGGGSVDPGPSEDFAQGFTTGGNTTDVHDLSSIQVRLSRAPGSGTLTVTVQGSNISHGFNVPALTVLHQLTPLTNPVGTGTQTFTAPSGATLNGGTTYFVYMSYAPNPNDPNDQGPSWNFQGWGGQGWGAQDSDSLPGWDIENGRFSLRFNQNGSAIAWSIDPGALKIRVQGPNYAPTAANNTVSTNEDTAYDFRTADFGFSDSNPADILDHVKITTPPTAGKLSLDGTDITSVSDTNPVEVTKVDLDNDKLKYTPEANANGSAVAMFDFKVSDGDLDSGKYTITIDVDAVNDAPVVSGTEELDYAENGTTVVGNYTATDPESNSITWSLSGDDRDEFSISSAGALTFNSPPDFEDPADANTDNDYLVTVQATDQPPSGNGRTGSLDIIVTVTNVNEAPVVSGTEELDYAENGTTVVGNYTATDPESNSITWSLSGDDRDEFSISSAGALTFNSPPDFEDPADANTDNDYLVTVQATDQPPSGNGRTGSLDIIVTVTTLNEAPVVSGTEELDYAENGTTVVGNYTATDPESNSITWSLSGDDRDEFSISSAGALTFNSPPDFEDPADANTDNDYLVTVQATDQPPSGNGRTGSLDIIVTVTNVNEAPVVSGTEELDYAENDTTVVGNYTATDPESNSITWSLSGDDRDEFSISSAGALTFNSPPDFEDPADANTDNDYLVTVQATDQPPSGNGRTGSLDVIVTVTNVTAATPAAPANLSAAAGDAQVALSWDDPGNNTITTYQYSTDGGTSFTGIGGSGATTTAYTVTSLSNGTNTPLTNGTQYTLAVRAVNASGHGAVSTVTATPGTPAAPTDLMPVDLDPMGVSGSEHSIEFDWTEPGAIPGITVTGYQYRYRPEVAINWSAWANSPYGTTSEGILPDPAAPELIAGVKYEFQVRAMAGNIPSDPSNSAYGTTKTPVVRPRILRVGGGAITINLDTAYPFATGNDGSWSVHHYQAGGNDAVNNPGNPFAVESYAVVDLTGNILTVRPFSAGAFKIALDPDASVDDNEKPIHVEVMSADAPVHRGEGIAVGEDYNAQVQDHMEQVTLTVRDDTSKELELLDRFDDPNDVSLNYEASADKAGAGDDAVDIVTATVSGSRLTIALTDKAEEGQSTNVWVTATDGAGEYARLRVIAAVPGANRPYVMTPLADRTLREDAVSDMRIDNLGGGFADDDLGGRSLELAVSISDDTATKVGDDNSFTWVTSCMMASVDLTAKTLTIRPLTPGMAIFTVTATDKGEPTYVCPAGYVTTDDPVTATSTCTKAGETDMTAEATYPDEQSVSDSFTVTIVSKTTPTVVEAIPDSELPTEVELFQNYPNPFNPQTTIDYALPRAGDVSLVVYDMLGREVNVLIDGPQAAGRHTVRFGANQLPNGAYVYRLVAGEKTITRTMALVK